MEKNENGIECEDSSSESIRTLNFGVRGLQRKRELIEERYARQGEEGEAEGCED